MKVAEPGKSRQDDRSGVVRAILLDDSELERKRVRHLLCQAVTGVEIVEAASIPEFRARLDECSFDLILLDFHLGMETGFDALRAVMPHPNQTRAVPIMLTGTAALGLADDAFREGCMEFLSKDQLKVPALSEAIDRAQKRKSVQMALRG